MSSCGKKHVIDRRAFLELMAAVSPALFLPGCSLLRIPRHYDEPGTASPEGLEDLAGQSSASPVPAAPPSAQVVADPHSKVVNFDLDFPDDILASQHDRVLIERIVRKFRAAQKYVGPGHFNLLGMDEFFRATQQMGGVDAITPDEKHFLESLFFRDAHLLGFEGDRVFKHLTENVDQREAVKVAGTGHFLRKGPALDTYTKIRRDVGPTLILTSGVRALAKQFHLFLEKTAASNGNYSRASRSIAPPGYSFHGLYDFDVGKIGFGLNNFTDDFASTSEFKELSRLGYVDIRYKERNDLGVRFEPWHIKI